MDFILAPNVAYLILVIGFIVVIFAILTPGTGILEAAGLILLGLLGWEIFNLPINFAALGLLIVSIVFFLLAIREIHRRRDLGIATGGYVLGSVFLFSGDVWWQPAVNPGLAFIVSAIAGGFLWILSDKVLEARSALPVHDLGVLVGSIGEARTDIKDEGSVYVDGELWSGFSDKKIPSGSRIEVLEREGLILKVKKVTKKD